MTSEKLNMENLLKKVELEAKVLEMIEEEGPIGFKRLTKIFRFTSEIKARWILDELEKRGLITRTIHGAITVENWRKEFVYSLNKLATRLMQLSRNIGFSPAWKGKG